MQWQVKRLQASLKLMLNASLKYGWEGGLSRLIVPLDRAALAQFLIEEAPEDTRLCVRSLLRDIWREFEVQLIAWIETKPATAFVPCRTILRRLSRAGAAKASSVGTKHLSMSMKVP